MLKFPKILPKVAHRLRREGTNTSDFMVQHEKIRRKAVRARIISVEQAMSLPQHVFEEFDKNAPYDEDVALPSFGTEIEDGDHEPELQDIPSTSPNISLEDLQADIQQAYDKGFSDGQAVTSALMESEIGKLREQNKNLDTLISDLHDQFVREIEQFQNLAVNVSIVCAEHILEREVLENTRLAVEQARKVLATMHGLRDVIIRVHPNSYEAMQDAHLDLLNSTNTLRKIDVQSDSSIQDGSCVLETQMGHVDAQLKTQLEQLRGVLHESARVKELTEEY